MTLIPGIKQISQVGNDMYIQGAFPVGVTNTEVAYLADPADTRLLAGRDPVIDEVSVGMSGSETDIKTATGAAPLQITDAMHGMLRFLETNIKPVQDLHGYANPWPGGGGVNKVDNDALLAGSYNKYGIANFLKNNTTYTYSVYGTHGYSYRLMLGHTNVATPSPNTPVSSNYLSAGSKETFTTGNDVESWEYIFFAGSAPGAGSAEVLFQVEDGSIPNPTYSPYSNICPIHGWTGCNVYVSPTTNQADATVYPCTWQDDAGTVYGGKIDLVSGFLEVTHKSFNVSAMDFNPSTPANSIYRTDSLRGIIVPTSSNSIMPNGISDVFGGWPWGSISVSNNGKFSIADITSSSSGRVVFIDHRYSSISNFIAGNADTHVLCELSTHEYYQVPGNQIMTQEGTNYIWTDCGDQITAAYVGNA